MNEYKALLPGYFYHLYNRGNNQENLFPQPENYAYFLMQWKKHIHPVAETFAYALLKNHFHALVFIRPLPDLLQLERFRKLSGTPGAVSLQISRCISHCFNAYAKAINKRCGRTGSLFQERFRRKVVQEEAYLRELILYIHANAQKHGFVANSTTYPHTSYGAILSDKPTGLQRQKVLDLFGGRALFCAAHQQYREKIALRKFFLENEGDDELTKPMKPAEPTGPRPLT